MDIIDPRIAFFIPLVIIFFIANQQKLKDSDRLALIAGVYGIFYTFMPHSVHIRYSPDWTLLGLNLSHNIHVLIGSVLLVVAFLNISKN